MKEPNKQVYVPSLDMIKKELDRLESKSKTNTVFRNTAITLIVVAALAILFTSIWFPFLQIYGVSMAPTLKDGEVVCCVKTQSFESNDIIAFYYNNKVLIKRVIGKSGDWIDIDADGTVYVNSERIDEPYISEKSYGNGNVEFPYQVPENSYFVLGDHRDTSIDSRYTSIGCVTDEQIVGKIVLRVWPLTTLRFY